LLVHLPNGWLFSNPHGGWEFPALWIVLLIVQALLGPGAYALKVPGLAEDRRESLSA
jgi:putative oxidoreductase